MGVAGGWNPFTVERHVLRTRYRPEACATFLLSAIQATWEKERAKPRDFWWFVSLARGGVTVNRMLIGKADQRGFRLGIIPANPAYVEAYGRFEAEPDGTAIHLRLTVDPWLRACYLILGLLILGVAIVVLAPLLLAGDFRTATVLRTLGLVVLGLVGGGHWLTYFL
jgi:hypothetical protein